MNKPTTADIRAYFDTCEIANKDKTLFGIVLDRLEAAEQDLADMTDFRDHWKLLAEKAEQTIRDIESKILAEYKYWKESDGESSVPAMGALSNVLAALHGHIPTHHNE